MKKILSLSIILMSLVMATAQNPQVIAHRGYWKAANGAQNSIEAFNKADSLGVYGSEFDVWLTKDNQLVVNHDRVFQGVDMRTAPSDSILALTLANGEQLPTLETFLDNAQYRKNTRLVLEVKPLDDLTREEQAAIKIVNLLKKYKVYDRTDIISFSINACLAFKKLCGDDLPIYYLDGDLPPRKIKILGLAGIDYHGSVLDAHPEWIQKAHELGLKVNVWTVDKPEAIKKYTEMGVDYITTNNPWRRQE